MAQAGAAGLQALAGVAPANALVGPPATPPVDSYRAFYSAADKDPLGGNYEGAMAEYAVAANPATPAHVLGRTMSAADGGMSLAFVTLCRNANAPNDDPGRIVCLHRVKKFHAMMGSQSAWSQQAFAFRRDVIDGQIQTVAWPEEAFHLTSHTRAATLAHTLTLLAADPGLDVLGPHGDADAGTEVTRTRRTSFVPQKYVEIFLDEDLLPRTAFERCHAALATDGNLVACEPLLTFLRLAMTVTATVPTHAAFATAYPTPPLLDAELSRHRSETLYSDLPGLRHAGAIQEGSVVIASAIGAFTEQSRLNRLADEQARSAREAKTPDKFYGDLLAQVLRFTHAPTAADLPPIYSKIAATSRHQQRPLVQAEVNAASQALQLPTRVPIAPKTCTRLIMAKYVMQDPEDLLDGLQPFLFGYKSPPELTTSEAVLATYDLVHSGAASPPSKMRRCSRPLRPRRCRRLWHSCA